MKRLIAAGFLILVLALSCMKETDYFYEGNNAPLIQIRSIGRAYGDTHREDSMKSSVGSLQYVYKIQDEHPKLVRVFFRSNYNTSEFSHENDSTFIYRSAICGEHQIVLCAQDVYERISRATTSIICFDNMPPVAVLKYKIQGNEILLDGSQSYDRDAKYGGKIKTYQFYLCGDTYLDTVDGKIALGVDINREVSIGLKVYDNENAWDETQQVIIGGGN